MQAVASELERGGCFSIAVATKVVAETGADFEVIEGCERGDFSFGDATGSTAGSTAEGVCSPNPAMLLSSVSPDAKGDACMCGWCSHVRRNL